MDQTNVAEQNQETHTPIQTHTNLQHQHSPTRYTLSHSFQNSNQTNAYCNNVDEIIFTKYQKILN